MQKLSSNPNSFIVGGARDEYEEINNHSQVLDHCPNGVDNSRARVSVSGPTNAESSTEAPSRVADNNNDHQLNVNHEVIYEIYGYRFSLSHVFLFYFLLAVCPLVGLILLLYHNLWAFCPLLGLPHLLVLWFPIIRTLRYEKCDVAYSDYMLRKSTTMAMIILFCLLKRFLICCSAKQFWLAENNSSLLGS